MATDRIRALVSWPVEPLPAARRVSAWTRTIGATALGLFPGLGDGIVFPEVTVDPVLPDDPDRPIETINVRGKAPWLPAASSVAGINIELYRDRAATTPGSMPGEPVELPLRTLRVTGTHCRTPRLGRQPDSAWTATVVGDDGTRLEIVGSRLALAWAAHLGGWCEPV